MYIIGRQNIDESFTAFGTAGEPFEHYYKWRIDWWHKSGGLKKTLYYGMSNVPLKEFEFELNKKLMGAATLDMIYLDFPVHADDNVKIYKENDLKWNGVVEEKPDLKGGKIKLVPLSSRYDKRFITKSYTAKTIAYMLEDIVDDYFEDTEIAWSSTYVNTGDTSTYDMDFQGVSIKEAFNKLMKKLSGRDWGVDENNIFHVYVKNSTVDQIITNNPDKMFTKLKTKQNASKIKATRSLVYKKNAAGQMTYVARVGDDLPGGSYPTLDVENLITRRDNKFTVSNNGVSDTLAKDWAYATLENDAVLRTSVAMEEFRMDKYDASIGDLLKIIDDPERIFHLFLDSDRNEITDSITNWTGAYTGSPSLYTDDYCSGSGAIQLTGSNTTNSVIYYDFGEIKRFQTIEKFIFAVQSEEDVGKNIQIGLSDTVGALWDNPYDIYINATDVWEFKYINISETSFRYIGFRMTTDRDITRNSNIVGLTAIGEFGFPSAFTLYRFDCMGVYGYLKEEYQDNVVKIKTKVDKKGESVTVTIGEYDSQGNERAKELEKRASQIEEIQVS